MDEKFAQSLLNTLASQRDQAMNALAQTEARLRVVEAELNELKEADKPKGPLADKVAS